MRPPRAGPGYTSPVGDLLGPRTYCRDCAGRGGRACGACRGAPDVCALCGRPECAGHSPGCEACGDGSSARLCRACADDPSCAAWRLAREPAAGRDPEHAARVAWGEGEAAPLTPTFQLLVALLLEGRSPRAAARAAGCSHALARRVAREVGL